MTDAVDRLVVQVAAAVPEPTADCIAHSYWHDRRFARLALTPLRHWFRSLRTAALLLSSSALFHDIVEPGPDSSLELAAPSSRNLALLFRTFRRTS